MWHAKEVIFAAVCTAITLHHLVPDLNIQRAKDASLYIRLRQILHLLLHELFSLITQILAILNYGLRRCV